MVDCGLIERILRGPGDPLQDATLIEHRFSDRLVPEYANVLAGLESRLRRTQDVPNHYDALLVLHEGGVCVRFDFDDENRAADGDYRSRRADIVVVRHAPEMLDLNADFAQENFEEVDPAVPIGAKDHPGIGINLELATVGDLKDAPSIGAS